MPGSRTRLGLLLLWLGVAGCATVPPPARPVSSHLIVINRTDYEWELRLSLAGGGAVTTVPVHPRATQDLELAAADYVIEQSSPAGGEALHQRLPVRLEAGKTYHWQLVTLLAAEGE